MPMDAGAGDHQVVGQFDGPDEARKAMLALEGTGIDANALHLRKPDTVPVRDSDSSGEQRAGEDVVKRYVGIGLVGAVVAGAVVGVIALVAGAGGGALIAAVLGGAIAGFVLAGFLGAARKLPVNAEALDSYTIDPSGVEPLRVEVNLDDPAMAQKAADLLREHRAIQVDGPT